MLAGLFVTAVRLTAPTARRYLCGNWCVLGPFVGFRHARIRGANMSWTEPRMEMAKDFASYKVPRTRA
jgi:hypothetical protein